MTEHVVPARRVYTLVHIRDPDVPADRRQEADPTYPGGAIRQLTPDSHDGRTICGQPMLVADLWQPWTPDQTADRICAACQTGVATHVQEALL